MNNSKNLQEKQKTQYRGRSVEVEVELRGHIKKHWETIKPKLLEGKYNPSPVRRVEIPKPDGGIRLLGIPTVQDR